MNGEQRLNMGDIGVVIMPGVIRVLSRGKLYVSFKQQLREQLRRQTGSVKSRLYWKLYFPIKYRPEEWHS